jgi:hypothetical protein
VSCSRAKPCGRCETILESCTGVVNDRATLFCNMDANTQKQSGGTTKPRPKRGKASSDVESAKPSSKGQKRQKRQKAALLGGLVGLACTVALLVSNTGWPHQPGSISATLPDAGSESVPAQPSGGDTTDVFCSAVDEMYHGRELGHRDVDSLDACTHVGAHCKSLDDHACAATCDYRCETQYEPFGEMRCVPSIRRYAGGMCRPTAASVDAALDDSAGPLEALELAEQSWREELAFVAAQSCASASPVPPAGDAGEAFLRGSWGPTAPTYMPRPRYHLGDVVYDTRGQAIPTDTKAQIKGRAGELILLAKPPPAAMVAPDQAPPPPTAAAAAAAEAAPYCFCKLLPAGDPDMQTDGYRWDGLPGDHRADGDDPFSVKSLVRVRDKAACRFSLMGF